MAENPASNAYLNGSGESVDSYNVLVPHTLPNPWNGYLLTAGLWRLYGNDGGKIFYARRRVLSDGVTIYPTNPVSTFPNAFRFPTANATNISSKAGAGDPWVVADSKQFEVITVPDGQFVRIYPYTNATTDLSADLLGAFKANP